MYYIKYYTNKQHFSKSGELKNRLHSYVHNYLIITKLNIWSWNGNFKNNIYAIIK